VQDCARQGPHGPFPLNKYDKMVVLNLIFLLAIIGIIGFWAYSVAVYDWSKFDEDSKDDDFLKPYDDK
jgi:hypothetical protein